MLDDFVLLGADNNRTRAYVDVLARRGLAPAQALFLAPAGPIRSQAADATELFDNETPAAEAARACGIDCTLLETPDINDASVSSALSASSAPNVIFSGYGGAIVGQALFATGKSFLHMHPGRLPNFRGSTTIYHSLLDTGEIWVSAILLAPKIDAGPVVGERRFDPPQDRTAIDTVLDPYYRALTLADTLVGYTAEGRFAGTPQPEGGGLPCFIIHPVLKHIALLSQEGPAA
jgi:methionyl-tRNA formyltransferase